MLKKTTQTFRKFLPASFSKRTASVMRAVKLKTIYDRYGAICDEIGRLLGEPEAQPQTHHKDIAETEPHTIQNFEKVWKWGDTQQRYTQTLSLVSGFFDAGFIARSRGDSTTIRSYFLDDEATEIQKALAFPLERITPLFSGDVDLKPRALDAELFAAAFRIRQLEWVKETVVFHFWLNPEEGISLIVISTKKNQECLELLLQTQQLIQHRFYDAA